MEELFEGSTIEDIIIGRTGVINDEFVLGSRSLGRGLWQKIKGKRDAQREPTEKITQQSSTGTDHLEERAKESRRLGD